MVSRKRGKQESKKEELGSRNSSHYTDKRTVISAIRRGLPLDARDQADLRSAPYDQTNQVRQYPSGRSEPGPGFLHRETRVHHHHRPAVRREAALDRAPRSESRDARRALHHVG